MTALSSKSRQALIRLVYFLPLISGAILFLHALIPHLYFLYNGAAYDTQSTLGLVANTWKESLGMLNGNTEGSINASYFAVTMVIFAALYWILLLSYLITSAVAAICSATAFSLPPTSREANKAKRWLRFFCPGRGLYIIVVLFPMLWTLFPHLLAYCYRVYLFYDMSIHFFGPSDLILGMILSGITTAAYLLLLPAQREEHMDMFRLYKAK